MNTTSYAESLSEGDKAYIWNGDVRYAEKVTKIDARYIHVSKSGRFGRKTGKGIDEPHMHLANAAGEK